MIADPEQVTAAAGGRESGSIVVASLNIHGMKQGWRRRAPAVLAALEAELPGVLVVQEAARWAPQPRWLACKLSRMVPREPYRAVTAPKKGLRRLIEGLAVVTRLPVRETATLDLGGDSRIAQRVTLAAPGGREFDLYNVHLAHRGEHEPLRNAQVRCLLDWVRTRPGMPAIVAGDFNADPDSTAIGAMLEVFRSAHALVHGEEPPFTAPANAKPGEGRTIDYVFVGAGVTVGDCRVAFGPVERHGQAVYPSDHLGLVASLLIEPASLRGGSSERAAREGQQRPSPDR